MARTRILRTIAALALGASVGACNDGETILWDTYGPRPAVADSSPYATRVVEYTPAPGQFIGNAMMGFTGTELTAEAAAEYAARRLEQNAMVSLGGFGGYIVVAFDHSVQARAAYRGYDISIAGNQFDGSSEPGVVWVMQDTDGNGIPDETWYELRGSEHATSQRGYSVTYTRPETDGDPVTWRDSDGAEGTISRVGIHTQPYYPAWIAANSYTLTGTRLPSRDSETDGRYSTGNYGWGYADNEGEDMVDKPMMKNFFRISDAVDEQGNSIELKYIDFIKVQTAVNIQGRGGVGELSTEVGRITDENLPK